MKMKICPECNGRKTVKPDYFEAGLAPTLEDAHAAREDNRTIHNAFAESYLPPCPTCEGTGEIPAESVSHCQACGEPILLGEKWCNFHKAAAELRKINN